MVSIARNGPKKGNLMNRRETYEPNMAKATASCLWLLFMLGATAAVVTAAVVFVVRVMS